MGKSDLSGLRSHVALKGWTSLVLGAIPGSDASVVGSDNAVTWVTAVAVIGLPSPNPNHTGTMPASLAATGSDELVIWAGGITALLALVFGATLLARPPRASRREGSPETDSVKRRS